MKLRAFFIVPGILRWLLDIWKPRAPLCLGILNVCSDPGWREYVRLYGPVALASEDCQ